MRGCDCIMVIRTDFHFYYYSISFVEQHEVPLLVEKYMCMGILKTADFEKVLSF